MSSASSSVLPSPSTRKRRAALAVAVILATTGMAVAAAPAALADTTTVVMDWPVPAFSPPTLLVVECPPGYVIAMGRSPVNGADIPNLAITLSSTQPGRHPADQTRLSANPFANALGGTFNVPGSQRDGALLYVYPAWTMTVDRVMFWVANPGALAGWVRAAVTCYRHEPGDDLTHGVRMVPSGWRFIGSKLQLTTGLDPLHGAVVPPDENRSAFTMETDLPSPSRPGTPNQLQPMYCNWSGAGDQLTLYDPVSNTFYVSPYAGAAAGQPALWDRLVFTPTRAATRPTSGTTVCRTPRTWGSKPSATRHSIMTRPVAPTSPAQAVTSRC